MCKKKPRNSIKVIAISIGMAILFLSLGLDAIGQDIRIELGKSEVALNETYTISIIIEGDRIRNYDEFPEISGFIKQAKSTSSSTNIINGKVTSSHRIVQNYQPNIEGTYTIPPFEMTINGQTYTSQGGRVRVVPAKSGQQQDPFARDPFEEFFGRSDEPLEFTDVEADVFFALTTEKNEVYVGEGFLVTLAYYQALNNQPQMRFHDLDRQIHDILKNIKQVNCWEENFEITRVDGVPIEINGKRYNQYKLYQAVLYPLNDEDIVFPKIKFDIVKIQVAKNPSFFGQRQRGEIIELVSDARVVKVKQLPPHPLRNRVAVGDYHLRESISSRNLETGISFNYEFNVVGEGNISAINNPSAVGKDIFDFYPPNIRQDINRVNNQITGSKSFSYFAIPKEPGTYNLGDYVEWTFFNPNKHRYETLKSRMVVEVTGESQKNLSISSADLGTFYDILEAKNNILTSRVNNGLTKIFANIIIFLMLALTLFILIRK